MNKPRANTTLTGLILSTYANRSPFITKPYLYSQSKLTVSRCKVSNFANTFLYSNPGNKIRLDKSQFSKFADNIVRLTEATDNSIWWQIFTARQSLTANFKCIRCNFTSITFSGSGGAIYSEGWDVKVFTSNITLCQVTGDGGGIYASESVNFVIDSVVFSNCSAGNRGGGLCYLADTVDANIRLRRINFSECTATGVAGGCYVQTFNGQTDLIYLMFRHCNGSVPMSCYVYSPNIAIETIYLYSTDQYANINISRTKYDIHMISDEEQPTILKAPSATFSPPRTPFQTPMRTPDLTPEETPSSTPATTPYETPSSTPATTPYETPSSTPAFTTPIPTVEPTPSASPFPTETPSMTPDKSPEQTPSSTPAKSPEQTPSTTPSESPSPSRSPTPSRSPFPPTSMFTPSAMFTPDPTSTATPTASTPPRKLHWSAFGIALLTIALLFIVIGLIANLILCMRVYESCDRIIEPEM